MNYRLRDYAAFFCYIEGWPAGLVVTCPNCGRKRMVWFRNPVGGGEPSRPSPLWDRAGETLETISLTQIFYHLGCYHAWIKDGELRVVTPFLCRPRPKEAA